MGNKKAVNLFVPMEVRQNPNCNKKAHGARERFSFLLAVSLEICRFPQA